MRVTTAVVLYFPDLRVIRRVIEYAEYSDFLIVVDNTDNGDLSAEFQRLSNVCYRALGANLGIATALNVAAQIAMSNRCSWMMTLDQDSVLTQQTYNAVKEHIVALKDERIGIVSPVQVSKESDLQITRTLLSSRYVSHVMTSGSTLNLVTYQHCGPFVDKLFIDQVDIEYCLRLGALGYRIAQLTQVVLEHSLGEIHETRFLGRTISVVSHKPFRSYYLVRNGLYVAVKYLHYRPRFLGRIFFIVAKSIFKALFFEDEKTFRLRMIFLGIFHFCIGRYGRLSVIDRR